MNWIIATTSPRMISAEELWCRRSARGALDVMRRIVIWRWGYIVVDEEPTWHELNSDEGLDVDVSEIISCDLRECEYIWEPKDRMTNQLVDEIDDLHKLFSALGDIGWQRVENNITMWGVLQKAKAKRNTEYWQERPNYGIVFH